MKCRLYKSSLFVLALFISSIVLGASGSTRTLVGGRIQNGNAVITLPTNTQTIQDIHTGASPTFQGLTLGTLNGVIYGTNGVLGASTITDADIAASAAIGWSKIDTSGSSLADLGTKVIDSLDDVDAANPMLNDRLAWNGTAWVPQSAQTDAGNGVEFFFDSTASDIGGGYETLLAYPAGGVQVTDSVAVTSGTSPVSIDNYASASAGLGGSQIDGGVWTFDIYGAVSSATGTTTISMAVYKRTAGGAESLLFTVTTPDINATSPQLYEVQSVQPSFAINATDRLVVKVTGSTTSVASVTLNFYYNGTTNYSHVRTPLVTRHNDLAGLQGGSSGERFHLTNTEHTTVTGHPSATNNPHSVTASQVGLGNVTNDAQLKAADLDTDGTLAANSDSKIPSQKAVKTYVDSKPSGSGSGAYNYVKNPNAATGIGDWTETDADNDASFAQDTTNKFQDLNSFAYDAADNVDKVCGDTNTVAGSFNGEASLWYKGDASAYKFEIQDGSGNTLHTVALENKTDWTRALLNYPATNGVKLCVVSAGNGAAINFTKVFYGEASNIGTADTSIPWKTYTPTYTNFPSLDTGAIVQYRKNEQNLEIKGYLPFTGAGAAGAMKMSIPAGLTIDTSGAFILSGIESTKSTYLISGTNTYPVSNQIATATEISFLVNSGSSSYVLQGSDITNGRTLYVNISVPIVGWAASSTSVSVDTSDQSGSFVTNASSNNSHSITTGTPTVATATGWGTRTNSGKVTACSGANDFCGKVSGLLPGKVLVKAKAAFIAEYVTTETVCAFELYDGTTSAGKTTLTARAAADKLYMNQFEGMFDYSSMGDRSFSVRFYRVSGGGNCVIKSDSTQDLGIFVEPKTQNVVSPIILNQIANIIDGSKVQIEATLNCDSASAITSQDGTITKGISAIGNISSGACSVTFAGMPWTVTPRCRATIKGSSLDQTARLDGTSTTAATLYCTKTSDATALTACDADIFCSGTR